MTSISKYLLKESRIVFVSPYHQISHFFDLLYQQVLFRRKPQIFFQVTELGNEIADCKEMYSNALIVIFPWAIIYCSYQVIILYIVKSLICPSKLLQFKLNLRFDLNVRMASIVVRDLGRTLEKLSYFWWRFYSSGSTLRLWRALFERYYFIYCLMLAFICFEVLLLDFRWSISNKF